MNCGCRIKVSSRYGMVLPSQQRRRVVQRLILGDKLTFCPTTAMGVGEGDLGRTAEGSPGLTIIPPKQHQKSPKNIKSMPHAASGGDSPGPQTLSSPPGCHSAILARSLSFVTVPDPGLCTTSFHLQSNPTMDESTIC